VFVNLTDKTKGYLALFGLAFSYALFGVFTRLLSQDFALFQQVYLRLAAAILVGAILFRNTPGKISIGSLTPHDILLLTIRALLTYVLGVAPYIYAVTHTSLANVAFIGALPVSALWGVLLFGEMLTPTRASLISLALVGVVLIAVKDLSALSQWGDGELCALIATLFFLPGTILVKKQTPGLPDSALTQYFMIFGFLVCFASSLALGEPLGFIPTWSNMITTLVAGSLITVNVVLGNYGFKRIPAMVGGNIMTLELIFVLLLGYLFYGEIPTPRAAIGGAIIAASVFMLTYVEWRRDYPT
jgi:drug/metabolite transporter (DMT)-like permease